MDREWIDLATDPSVLLLEYKVAVVFNLYKRNNYEIPE